MLSEYLKALAKALGLKILPASPEQFVAKTMVLPVIFEKEGVRVDIVFANSAYELEALKRTRKVDFGGSQVHIASPEDVIIHKAVAGRDRDLEDVRKIMARQKGLDLRYIRKWLKSMDTALSTSHLKTFEKTAKSVKTG
jgi:predicted nucleotidyltransferase